METAPLIPYDILGLVTVHWDARMLGQTCKRLALVWSQVDPATFAREIVNRYERGSRIYRSTTMRLPHQRPDDGVPHGHGNLWVFEYEADNDHRLFQPNAKRYRTGRLICDVLYQRGKLVYLTERRGDVIYQHTQIIDGGMYTWTFNLTEDTSEEAGCVSARDVKFGDFPAWANAVAKSRPRNPEQAPQLIPICIGAHIDSWPGVVSTWS